MTTICGIPYRVSETPFFDGDPGLRGTRITIPLKAIRQDDGTFRATAVNPADEEILRELFAGNSSLDARYETLTTMDTSRDGNADAQQLSEASST